MDINNAIRIIRSTSEDGSRYTTYTVTRNIKESAYEAYESIENTPASGTAMIIAPTREFSDPQLLSFLSVMSCINLYIRNGSIHVYLTDDGVIGSVDKSPGISLPPPDVFMETAESFPPNSFNGILVSAEPIYNIPCLSVYRPISDVDTPVDIVIPLGSDAKKSGNEELRLALRSIDKNANNVGNIFLVTDSPPDWITNVTIMDMSDTFTENKDANLIRKVLKACVSPDVSERFIFWSDDQVINLPYDLQKHKPSYNNKGITYFTANASNNRWIHRMANTLNLVKEHNGDCNINWDSHVPQPMDKTSFKELIGEAPYVESPGLCINTAYFGLKYEPAIIRQDDIKHTFEKPITEEKIAITKPFTGYNDKGFRSGLRDSLFQHFCGKSKYER